MPVWRWFSGVTGFRETLWVLLFSVRNLLVVVTCAATVVHVIDGRVRFSPAGFDLCHEFAAGAVGSGMVLIALFEL